MKLLKVKCNDAEVPSLGEAVKEFGKILNAVKILSSYKDRDGNKPRASVKNGRPMLFKLNIGAVPEIKEVTKKLEQKYPDIVLYKNAPHETVWGLEW